MELNLKAAQAQSDFDLEEIKMTTDRKNRLDDLASKGLRNADDVEEDRRIASEAVETAKQAQDTQMALLAQALTAPKRIVRDENGQPVGMETVIEEANYCGAHRSGAFLVGVWKRQQLSVLAVGIKSGLNDTAHTKTSKKKTSLKRQL